MTDEDIVDALTDGWRPIEQCFLFQGDICGWDLESQMIDTYLIDDDELRVECEQYLLEHGSVCHNMDAVRHLARKFHWPNWNR